MRRGNERLGSRRSGKARERANGREGSKKGRDTRAGER